MLNHETVILFPRLVVATRQVLEFDLLLNVIEVGDGPMLEGSGSIYPTGLTVLGNRMTMAAIVPTKAAIVAGPNSQAYKDILGNLWPNDLFGRGGSGRRRREWRPSWYQYVRDASLPPTGLSLRSHTDLQHCLQL